MELKQAVVIAKTYLWQAFENEKVGEIRLEEIEYKEDAKEWLITLGIYRPSVGNYLMNFSTLHQPLKKSYKVVRVSDEKERVLSVKNRETGEE